MVAIQGSDSLWSSWRRLSRLAARSLRGWVNWLPSFKRLLIQMLP